MKTCGAIWGDGYDKHSCSLLEGHGGEHRCTYWLHYHEAEGGAA